MINLELVFGVFHQVTKRNERHSGYFLNSEMNANNTIFVGNQQGERGLVTPFPLLQVYITKVVPRVGTSDENNRYVVQNWNKTFSEYKQGEKGTLVGTVFFFNDSIPSHKRKTASVISFSYRDKLNEMVKKHHNREFQDFEKGTHCISVSTLITAKMSQSHHVFNAVYYIII